MKTNIHLTIIAIIMAIAACDKIDTMHFQHAEITEITDNASAFKNFSIALSKAVCKHKEVRDFIKDEALKCFDNDYDILYHIIKNNEIADLGTFREILIAELGNEQLLTAIEQLIPSLTIYVSDATWFDPDGFCANKWNTDAPQVAVTYKEQDGLCHELYSNGYHLGKIDIGTIPGGAVLIVKTNERIIASTATKSGDFTYSFIDEAFDKTQTIATKGDNRHKGKYSVSWVEGQAPEDNSDIISAEALNKLNPDIIKAYELFKDHPYALQNDFIYYGLTASSPKGKLRTDVRSKIVRFKISPNSFKALFDDPNDDDKNFVDSFETDDNGKGYDAQPNTSTIYSKLWADGYLEIRIRVVGYGSDEKAGICKDFHYDVTAKDLFTVKNNSIKKEEWGSTMFKWYITWRYSIDKRDHTTLVEKWYYPENTPDLPTWDLMENSVYSIVVSEEDTGTQTSYTVAHSAKKANSKTGRVSREISGSGNIGSIVNISATYKNELGWSSSDEETTNTTATLTWVNGDEHMTKTIISFGDKYIRNQASSTSYNVYSYESNRFTFTILPYRY